MSSLSYTTANALCRYVMLPLYAHATVSGLENVPPEGPLLVASNHLSDSDPGIISTKLPRTITYMAKAELFKIPLLKQFLQAYGAFPVRRNEADIGALKEANKVLRGGSALCIFPEGTASREKGQLAEAWPGVGLIALRAGAPILPLALTGSQHMHAPFPFFRPWKRYRVTVTCGEPFFLPAPERINSETAQQATAQIMERIAALLPEDYHGYYRKREVAEPGPDRPQSEAET